MRSAGKHLNEKTLAGFHARRLDEAARVRAQKHLDDCPACRSALRDLADGEQFGLILREARRDTAPGLREQLVDRAARVLRAPSS